MSEAVHVLRDLKLKRVSIVDQPANEHARVVLWKSAEAPVKKDAYNHIVRSEDDVMCSKCSKASKASLIERGGGVCPNCGAKMPAGAMKMKEVLDKISDPEVRKAVDAVVAAIMADLQKAKDDTKAAEDLAAEEQAKRIAAEKAAKKDPEEDDVLKGLSPGARARLEKAEKDSKEAREAVLKMTEDRREREFIQKARAFGNLSLKPETFGLVMKRVSDGTATAEDVKEIERVLAAANHASKALFLQKGSNERSDGTTSAMAQIEAKAAELRDSVVKSGEKMTRQEAVDRVIKENPGLYEQHIAEIPRRKAAAGGSAEQDEE